MDKENVTVKTQSSGNLMVVSLILMVLSCVLFVGTTLAWFTDQTSGGVNRIQAGNLDAKLWIGESEPLKVKLDSDSDTQQTNGENATAVPLKLRKVVTKTESGQVVFDRISTDATAQTNPQEAVWNPGDIFISDVMQVVKASGSVPFDYKLELLIDPAAQSTEPLKAKNVIDFRIVDVSEISSLSTDENSTRTYDYRKIAACFPAPASQPEAAQNDLEKTNELTESTPIIWSSDNEEQTTPTNVFSSEPANNEEPTENETQVQFVILAKLKPDVLVDTNSTDTIENPFSLIVTLKQLKAEHFEPAAEAGDVS